jgi:hypothetical protein
MYFFAEDGHSGRAEQLHEIPGTDDYQLETSKCSLTLRLLVHLIYIRTLGRSSDGALPKHNHFLRLFCGT